MITVGWTHIGEILAPIGATDSRQDGGNHHCISIEATRASVSGDQLASRAGRLHISRWEARLSARTHQIEGTKRYTAPDGASEQGRDIVASNARAPRPGHCTFQREYRTLLDRHGFVFHERYLR